MNPILNLSCAALMISALAACSVCTNETKTNSGEALPAASSKNADGILPPGMQSEKMLKEFFGVYWKLGMSPDAKYDALSAFYQKEGVRFSVNNRLNMLTHILATSSFHQDPAVFEKELKFYLAETDRILAESPKMLAEILNTDAAAIRCIAERKVHIFSPTEKNSLCAEKLFQLRNARLTGLPRVRACAALAINSIPCMKDLSFFDKYMAELLKMTAGEGKSGPETRLRADALDRYAEALGKLIAVFPEEAAKRIDARKAIFQPKHIATLKGALLQYEFDDKNRPGFDRLYAEFIKLPYSPEKLAALLQTLGSFAAKDPQTAWKMMDSYAAGEKALDDFGRARILEWKLRTGSAKYSDRKAAALELWKLVGDKKLRFNLAPSYGDMFRIAIDNGNFEFPAQFIEKADNADLYLKYGLLTKNNAMIANALEKLRARKNLQPEILKVYDIVEFLTVKGGKCADFDNVFASWKCSNADKLTLLRKTERMVFPMRRYDLIDDIDREINAKIMKHPKPVFFDVKFVDFAPKSAGAWAYSEYYNAWNKMTEPFLPYGGYYNNNTSMDIQWNMVDSKIPALDPEYRTAIHCLADLEGCHIYVRSNAPDMIDVIQGKGTTGGLEVTFKSSYDGAYRWWSVDPPAVPEDKTELDWTGASKDYSMTRDFLKSDCALTKEASVAHFFIPWMMCVSELPVDGNMWYLGLVRGCKGMPSINGQHVHEQERMLRLRFAFTPEQLTRIQKNIAKTAFNAYKKQREDQGGYLLTWNDGTLGDPDFFTSKIEPLLKELDEAGETLQKTDDPRVVADLFKKYVPLWNGIRFKAAELRGNYLSEKLLK